eukprot:UN05494
MVKQQMQLFVNENGIINNGQGLSFTRDNDGNLVVHPANANQAALNAANNGRGVNNQQNPNWNRGNNRNWNRGNPNWNRGNGGNGNWRLNDKVNNNKPQIRNDKRGKRQLLKDQGVYQNQANFINMEQGTVVANNEEKHFDANMFDQNGGGQPNNNGNNN